VTARADFRPGASPLALAGTGPGEQVAAFLLSLGHGTVGAPAGIVHILGTRPQWRRRGLAAILISHALAAYQKAGLTTARVQVCSSNTRAVALYTGLGFSASGPGYALLFAPIP
jgi:ribosomal protein S18 acetylase RimI-like enzyme